MRSVRIALASLVLVTSAVLVAGPALAAKAAATFQADPIIKTCGIAEFDSTFNDAARIQKTVADIYNTLTDARANVNTTLGVATDAPVATAMKDLQTKAAGKVKVAMDGGKPKLKASDAVPENVQKGLDATNNLVDAGQKAVDDSKALIPQAQALATAAAAFPMKLPTMLGSLTADQAKNAPPIVSSNGKGIKLIPANIQVIADQVAGIFTDIKTAFGG